MEEGGERGRNRVSEGLRHAGVTYVRDTYNVVAWTLAVVRAFLLSDVSSAKP